ncbi:MAG: hypothetical protein A2Y57_01130 [Candidatus Woykebacteria bacterium RBG_13_40_7b]|uniref:Uncharacterized protein n=1 Tax=Candidatus Woykebacteria bacterium RBG_13_40_7b TaxID=1802594 RepID=A0A1G1WB31_9BACT|nr:MAG: hypothetical protein A2Y57_01130 [Candidatus Woykebacteria bacterium RBG_13_40_7b]
MAKHQATPGQYWEMVKALGDRLPKDLGEEGYNQDPAWYNNQVAALVRLSPSSEEARQLERILTSGALTAAILNNPYAEEMVCRQLSLPKGFVPAEPEKFLVPVLAWLEQQGIDFDPSRVNDYAKKWPHFEGAHGFCVMPKPHLLGSRLGVEDPLANLGLLTERGPLAAITSQRKIKNWRKEQMGSEYYELVVSARDAILELAELQPEGGFLVFPISTGDGFGEFNPSPRNALCQAESSKSPRKWPIPSYGGLWYVFANPNRISRYEDLCMDFIGDKIRLGPSVPFDHCSYLSFSGGKLDFGSRWLRNPDERFGPVFGFLP